MDTLREGDHKTSRGLDLIDGGEVNIVHTLRHGVIICSDNWIQESALTAWYNRVTVAAINKYETECEIGGKEREQTKYAEGNSTTR
jgi:hypothetical protein